jgi:propionyl-CoA carboxylase alpha chain
MYYDPMISKLITWGKDRKEALALLANAMDEYVIRGVTHNVGFGRSILRNKDFTGGSYTTAFIPTFYPTGFRGDPLDDSDHQQLALSAHYLKNLYAGFNNNAQNSTLYVTLAVGDEETDYKVEQTDKSFTLTNLKTNKSVEVNASDFEFRYGSILRFKEGGEQRLVQFLEAKDNLHFGFYYKGNTLDLQVYDEHQYPLKHYMAKPKKVDYGKSVISPMPGSIVSVSVEVGQTVTEGQELLVVEAMKMQNLIKSEVDGKIKKVNVKQGQSVAVDELLIEYV